MAEKDARLFQARLLLRTLERDIELLERDIEPDNLAWIAHALADVMTGRSLEKAPLAAWLLGLEYSSVMLLVRALDRAEMHYRGDASIMLTPEERELIADATPAMQQIADDVRRRLPATRTWPDDPGHRMYDRARWARDTVRAIGYPGAADAFNPEQLTRALAAWGRGPGGGPKQPGEERPTKWALLLEVLVEAKLASATVTPAALEKMWSRLPR